jgi:tRNA-specific 2-thiouridylase
LYVVALDSLTNTVVTVGKADVFAREFIVSGVNWMVFEKLAAPVRLKTRIRYLHHEADSVITPFEKDQVHVQFDELQMAVTPGQSAVFYEGDVCAGGGTIERVLH